MQKIIAPILMLLFVAACDAQPTDSFRSGHTQRMMLSVPDVLVDRATRKNKPLNLNDPEQVAQALGVALSGDKKQVLYVIAMTAPTADQGVVRREIPIRVDNIREGAHMIRQWQ